MNNRGSASKLWHSPKLACDALPSSSLFILFAWLDLLVFEVSNLVFIRSSIMKWLTHLQIVTFGLFFVSTMVSAQTRLVAPEWTFSDDFEGARDSSVWLGSGVYVDYGVVDPTNSANKVMRMRYVPNSEGDGDSWSEYDFKIGVDAVQVVLSWRQYVPTSYDHIENNHKVFALWSGTYGKVKANISVSSEAWGSDSQNGALPSVYVGVDGSNYGHNMNSNNTPIWIDGEGKWITFHVFLELAENSTDFGRMEIYRDGNLITGTHSNSLTKAYSTAPTGYELIKYSTRGNYIDQGTVLGWANGDTNGGFEVETQFLIDDFKIQANTVHGETESVSAPLGPVNVIKSPN